MINNRRVLGIIPARAGSKGLPGKNMRDLGGRPLLQWSIESGRKSKYIDDLIVSTDSLDMRDLAINCGALAPFLRPADLALDHSKTIDVVFHAIDFMFNSLSIEYDYVVLLEPTSPLREDGDIDSMLEILDEKYEDCDSIISVGEVSAHPSIIKKIENGFISPFCPGLPQTTRRQDNQPAFFPFCVAYIAKTAALRVQETFYTERSFGYFIKREQCYEIDDLYDFLCVEAILMNRGCL